MPQTQMYKAKSGKTQYKPSIELLTDLSHEEQGFCLACANIQDGVAPDARKYVCESCGEPKVYGAEKLTLMGLCY